MDVWTRGVFPAKSYEAFFEGAVVDRRYSNMDAQEVFTKTSLKKKRDLCERSNPARRAVSNKILERFALELTEID